MGPLLVPELEKAVEAGGGVVSGLEHAHAVVYTGGDDPTEVPGLIHSTIEWVQLPYAGVDQWAMAGVITEHPVWTSAAGAYAPQVAEHALALLLAAARALPLLARAGRWTRSPTSMLTGSTVGLFGASATSRELVRLLAPLHCRILGVSDWGELPGAEYVVKRSERGSILPDCDYVVLATSLTAQTAGMIGAEEFALMKAGAWIVNVARGGLIRTDDLVTALTAGKLGGAALDVTDPEPLPEQHPLWGFDNVLITPHCANPEEAVWKSLAVRVTENVARFAAGEPLLGRIDLRADPCSLR